tara:strand:- start:591 stop:1487 length:897 start_codon:yes stop_codon:yes gene_type:complete
VKFGKVDSTDDLNGIIWDFPQTSIEFSSSKYERVKVSAGGTMWTIRPWRGSVYPQKDPMRTWPKHYGSQFGNIELNATHYKIYPRDKMLQWAELMPDEFKFCPKFPAIISHYRRLNNCAGPTDDFIEGMLAMGEKLGPAFLQLPPHFGPKHSEKLIEYLESWPRELKMAVEFRHPEWFKRGHQADSVWETMSRLGIGAVICDTATRRDALHMRVTAPFILVRFGGYSGHKSDKLRIKNWVKWIASHSRLGIESFYFLVHQKNSLYTPKTCIEFAELCKKTMGIYVKSPIIKSRGNIII